MHYHAVKTGLLRWMSLFSIHHALPCCQDWAVKTYTFLPARAWNVAIPSTISLLCVYNLWINPFPTHASVVVCLCLLLTLWYNCSHRLGEDKLLFFTLWYTCPQPVVHLPSPCGTPALTPQTGGDEALFPTLWYTCPDRVGDKPLFLTLWYTCPHPVVHMPLQTGGQAFVPHPGVHLHWQWGTSCCSSPCGTPAITPQTGGEALFFTLWYTCPHTLGDNLSTRPEDPTCSLAAFGKFQVTSAKHLVPTYVHSNTHSFLPQSLSQKREKKTENNSQYAYELKYFCKHLICYYNLHNHSWGGGIPLQQYFIFTKFICFTYCTMKIMINSNKLKNGKK